MIPFQIPTTEIPKPVIPTPFDLSSPSLGRQEFKAPQILLPRIYLPNGQQVDPEDSEDAKPSQTKKEATKQPAPSPQPLAAPLLPAAPEPIEETPTKQEQDTITLPIVDVEIAVPSFEEVTRTTITAGAAATASTAAALSAAPLLLWLSRVLKPGFQAVIRKLLKLLGRNPKQPETWARLRMARRHDIRHRKGSKGGN